MPNHCENNVSVRGPVEVLEEFVSQCVLTRDKEDGGGDVVDFEKLVPMPEELRGIQTGFRTINGETHERWREVEIDGKEEVGFEPLDPVEEMAMRRKYGCPPDWYHWNLKNWGTKWRAYMADPIGGSTEAGLIRLRFHTAWSPPLPIIERLRKMYPDLDIGWTWRDEFEGEEVAHAV